MIPESTKSILSVSVRNMLYLRTHGLRQYEVPFGGLVGGIESMDSHAEATRRRPYAQLHTSPVLAKSFSLEWLGSRRLSWILFSELAISGSRV